MENYNINGKEIEALRYIRNSILHGQSPSIRDVQKKMGYGSPRSAAIIIERLIKKNILRRFDGNIKILNDIKSSYNTKTIDVPLVGTVSCGTPIFAQENIEAYFPVSDKLAHAGSKHFLLRAKGDSMNLAGINEGDLVLIRQQPSAENGQKVVALIDDEATIKIIKFTTEAIILEPKSTNKNNKPIILSRDFQIQGIVIATIPISE